MTVYIYIYISVYDCIQCVIYVPQIRLCSPTELNPISHVRGTTLLANQDRFNNRKWEKNWLGDARRMLRATCLGRKYLTSHTSQICTLVALSLLSSLPAMEAGEMVNANSYKQEW